MLYKKHKTIPILSDIYNMCIYAHSCVYGHVIARVYFLISPFPPSQIRRSLPGLKTT